MTRLRTHEKSNAGHDDLSTRRERLDDADDHVNHVRAAASNRTSLGRGAGVAVCLDCRVVLAWLPPCGVWTQKGTPCDRVVRVDLGHTTCSSHVGRVRW